MVEVVAYTIYHSPNAYLGLRLAATALAGLDVRVERRPLHVPRGRGVLVADLVGGHEPASRSAYNREDCTRWAARHGIPLRLLPPEVFAERRRRWAEQPFGREELPARAYYAAVGSGRETALDAALFEAAWVHGLDVNEPEVVRRAAAAAGLDADRLLEDAVQERTKAMAEAALAAFDREQCPGVPTWVVAGERYWGKDRVDWLADRVRALVAAGPAGAST